MSKLEIPRCEINTREALQNILVDGICHTVRNMENGMIVDFKEIVEDLKIDDLPYLHLKQQAIKEAKLRLNNVLTYVDDMIFLDYRECGTHGEPKVVHIDQEWDYKITPLSDSFEKFIRGLVNEEDFELED